MTVVKVPSSLKGNGETEGCMWKRKNSLRRTPSGLSRRKQDLLGSGPKRLGAGMPLL